MKYLLQILIIIFILSCNNHHKVTSIDEVSINYCSYNSKNKTPILFIHGWSCDQTYWKNQVEHFSKQFNVVTLDLAGHGLSGLNRKDWNIQNFAKDVSVVIRKLKLSNVILVGHSMGGAVMLETYQQIPEKIKAIIGVDTYKNIEKEPLEPNSIEDILKPFKDNFKNKVYDLAYNMTCPETDSILRAEIVNDMSSAPEDIALNIQRELMKYNYVEAFHQVEIPIYSINSDRYENNIEGAKRNTKSFEVVFMSNVGHFGMLEDPESFNTILSELLETKISQIKSATNME